MRNYNEVDIEYAMLFMEAVMQIQEEDESSTYWDMAVEDLREIYEKCRKYWDNNFTYQDDHYFSNFVKKWAKTYDTEEKLIDAHQFVFKNPMENEYVTIDEIKKSWRDKVCNGTVLVGLQDYIKNQISTGNLIAILH